MSDPIFEEHALTCPRCHDLVRIRVPKHVSGETAGEVLERQAKDQRIRDLEREVERLKLEIYSDIAPAEADRADAERFKKLVSWMLPRTPREDALRIMRDNLDADRAGFGQDWKKP